jgi:hypothetical protein
VVTGWSSFDGRLFDDGAYYNAANDPDQPWNLTPGLDPDVVSDADLWDWGLAGHAPSTGDTFASPEQGAAGGWSS